MSHENALLVTRYILNLYSTYCPGDRWRISWLPIPISGWPWSQQRTFSGRCRYATTRRASTIPQGLCRHSLAPSKIPLIATIITCCCSRPYSRILMDCGKLHDGISLVFSARSRRCTNVQCACALRRRRGKGRGHLVLLLFPKSCPVYGARFCERHARSDALLFGAAPPIIACRGLDTGQRRAEPPIAQGRKQPVVPTSSSESRHTRYWIPMFHLGWNMACTPNYSKEGRARLVASSIISF